MSPPGIVCLTDVQLKTMKRLQNRIAESRFALPVTAAYAVAVCLAGGIIENRMYVQFCMFALSSLLMVWLNNSNSLIRTYSRMVSCSYIALTMMAFFVFSSLQAMTVQLCVIAAYAALFKSYQDKRSQGLFFYAFLCIGIASTQFIQILFFVPVLLILSATNLMSLSFRSVAASLFGLILPYWFLTGYYVYTDSLDTLYDHFAEIVRFEPLFQYGNTAGAHQLATLAFLVVITLTGMIHFLRTSYKDKIKTRMMYEFVITMNLLTFVFLALQPRHFMYLTAIAIINSSILIAHYITLTKTRITNISFYLLSFATLTLTVYNIWIH